MPITDPFTYIYLILWIADALFIPVAIFKKDYEMLEVFVPLLFLLGIGFSTKFQICPMWYCAG